MFGSVKSIVRKRCRAAFAEGRRFTRMRSVDTFAYNLRGEVASAVIAENVATYAYDLIVNSTTSTWNSATNYYYANSLNQYVEVAAPETPYSASYSPDGELTSFKTATYGYDALSRLTVVRTNDEFAAEYAYDHLSRRVRKIARDGVHTFFYDGWNLVLELIIRPGGVTDRIEYYWGKDLSGTLQGAGGIGGLLYLKYNGAIYIPFYDAYGNILGYWNATGDVVASYTYDAFGKTISSTGPLADVFNFRYSTKYFDSETELYYYGYRYYSPELRRWITRDPIEEDGGINVYAMCNNSAVNCNDLLGTYPCPNRSLKTTELRRINAVTKDLCRVADHYLSAICEFRKKYFHQARGRYNVWFFRPEIDRTADLSKLPDAVVNTFALEYHRRMGTLDMALSQIEARLIAIKRADGYSKYRMSTCFHIPCMIGLIDAVSDRVTGDIVICRDFYEHSSDENLRGLIAHEISHIVSYSEDYYLWFEAKCLYDAYAYGLLFDDTYSIITLPHYE